jgi:hypothetical protein
MRLSKMQKIACLSLYLNNVSRLFCSNTFSNMHLLNDIINGLQMQQGREGFFVERCGLITAHTLGEMPLDIPSFGFIIQA